MVLERCSHRSLKKPSVSATNDPISWAISAPPSLTVVSPIRVGKSTAKPTQVASSHKASGISLGSPRLLIPPSKLTGSKHGVANSSLKVKASVPGLDSRKHKAVVVAPDDKPPLPIISLNLVASSKNANASTVNPSKPPTSMNGKYLLHWPLSLSNTANVQVSSPGVSFPHPIDERSIWLTDIFFANLSVSLLMNFNIIVWNAQGCGSNKFVRTARQYIRDHSPDIFVFVETRISGSNIDNIVAQLGFDNSSRVEAASLDYHQRHVLWHCFCLLHAQITEPWVIIGDFNATPYASDRNGCASSTTPNTDFQNTIFYCGLHDMDFHGPSFTWFKVQDNWNGNAPLASTISSFSKAVESWNLNVYGFLGTNKRRLMAQLFGVQRRLNQHHSATLFKLERKLQRELASLLNHEKLLWK
ncbi:hypothetical protein V6N13_125373 [Hibiscus sabdariffa]